MDAILSRYGEATAAMARAANAFLIARFPDIEVEPDEAANVIGYGHGPGYKGLVCALLLSKKGVKLGLNRGAELPDPHHLLTGTGKVHRYVELTSAEVLDDPRVADLLDAALLARRNRG